MGVIYKFKKEVLDFILQQKRENHGLSCRQLAVLTSEKFKLLVSKSSVNAIIKNARLSSGVGRRPGFDQVPRKFQIPPRKKKQFSDEMRKVGIEKKKQPAAPTSRPVEPLSVALTRAPQAKVIAQDFSGQAERLRQERFRLRRSRSRLRRRGPDQEGMGCVFLKAAQWELSGMPVFGKILPKYARQPLPSFFSDACDMLPCLSVLGVASVDQIGQFSSHALWTFFSSSASREKMLEAFCGLGYIAPSRRLFFEYEQEKEQMLVEAGEFRILLEDGSEVVMDARLTGLWPQKAPSQFSAPLERAMAVLSHRVASNNRPAIFLSSGGEQFHQGVWGMIAAWEGLANKRFKKLDVLNPSGELLATFSSFPNKKRIFMLGIWPWQEEFALFSQGAGSLEPFYCEELDRIVYAGDRGIPPDLFQGRLSGGGPFRAIAVSMSSPAVVEAIILTNWAQGEGAAKEVAGTFLRRWPYLDKGPAGRACLSRRAQPGDSGDAAVLSKQTDLFVLAADLGEALREYCQKRFFYELSISDTTCYKMPGCCLSGKEWLAVFLKPSAGYERLEELRLAAQRLNESAVTDPWNRQLFVTIE